MPTKKSMAAAITALIAWPALTQAEIEVSAVIKNETAAFLQDGQRTGMAASTNDTSEGEAGDLMKFENTAKVFFNGDMGEESSWHGELNFIVDTKAIDDYRGPDDYTQHDWLRELYVDTNAAGWDFRLGKQQVVWGTADGIKILDMINPTDYRELSQNDLEDSRIPVWMINAERNVGENGNIQLIVSQVEENKIPGLNADGDSGHPFIMKGVDTITGPVNGFLNIGNAMGFVTATFAGGGSTNPASNPNAELTAVDGFVGGTYSNGNCNAPGANVSGQVCLENFTELTNNNVTNLIDVDTSGGNLSTSGWDVTNPNSTWEYMPNASFATFNAFVNMTTEYKVDKPDDLDSNFGMRYRGNLDNGMNFGVNYLYAYDPNPVVNIYWADPNTGEKLTVSEHATTANTTVIQLSNAAGNYYGANADYNPGNYTGTAATDVTNANNAGPAQLVFEQTMERVHNIGGSFDYAIDIADSPIVLRGEFLYQKDVHQPVVDRNALARGDLTDALKTEQHDFFKYALGLDTTFGKNLFTSLQFIQFRNLDYIDEQSTCATQTGATINCSRYTADQAAMHLTNGMQKAEENKNFYSLYLSKPFGEADLGRVNNVLIYEEGDGYWNQLSAEYSLSDALVLTGQVNLYWGDENTTFGQFENSSNAQVGVKWILE